MQTGMVFRVQNSRLLFSLFSSPHSPAYMSVPNGKLVLERRLLQLESGLTYEMMWLTSGGKFEQAACNHAVNGVFITWVGMGSSHFVIWFPCWIWTSERWCDLFKGSLSALKNCFEVLLLLFFFAENRLHMFQNWCSAGKASWSHFAPQPTPVLLPGKSMDGGAWWAAVQGVAKSRTRLSDFTFTSYFPALEKEMATHSSVLAWRIPGMGEAWWTAVYGVAQSRTRLKRLSSSSTYLYDSPSRTVVCWPSVKALTQLGSYQVRYPQWNDRPRVPCEPFWHLGQEGDDSDTHMCFFPRRCTSARSSTC